MGALLELSTLTDRPSEFTGRHLARLSLLGTRVAS